MLRPRDARPSRTSPLTKSEYSALAEFRFALRGFLRFAETAARSEGLTAQQHQMLLALRGQPDKDWATVGELASALQLRHHSTCELIDRCERLRLVHRIRDLTDGRRVRVVITPAGLTKLDRVTLRNRRELHTLRALLDRAVTPGRRRAEGA
jgi:DNA-binding MarR family transcriptional regulator